MIIIKLINILNKDSFIWTTLCKNIIKSKNFNWKKQHNEPWCHLWHIYLEELEPTIPDQFRYLIICQGKAKSSKESKWKIKNNIFPVFFVHLFISARCTFCKYFFNKCYLGKKFHKYISTLKVCYKIIKLRIFILIKKKERKY